MHFYIVRILRQFGCRPLLPLFQWSWPRVIPFVVVRWLLIVQMPGGRKEVLKEETSETPVQREMPKGGSLFD